MTSYEASPEKEKSTIEIERKFLVKNIPESLGTYQHEQILQGYLVIGSDGSEARLRNRGGSYTLTVKSQGDLSRSEWETQIDKNQFDTLWPATEGRRIEKIRYSIPLVNNLIELDIYQGKHSGLVIAEVEFSDEQTAIDFEMPSWLGDDVTKNKSYKNQQLATNNNLMFYQDI